MGRIKGGFRLGKAVEKKRKESRGQEAGSLRIWKHPLLMRGGPAAPPPQGDRAQSRPLPLSLWLLFIGWWQPWRACAKSPGVSWFTRDYGGDCCF